MSRKSIFTHPDSDESFASASNEPDRPASPGSSSLSDESIELIDYVEPPTTDPDGSEAASGPRFEEAIFVESSSDTGQATVGSSTSSGAKMYQLKNNSCEKYSSESSSMDPSVSNKSESNTRRRSGRMKSISGETNSTQQSSSNGNMDKVFVSSSADPNSESSEQFTEELTPSQELNKNRVLQVRLHRMSIDMSNLKVQSVTKADRSRNESTHSETSTGPSPRKMRARIPSSKCLESFNLEDLQLSPRGRPTRNRTPSKRYSEHMEQTKTRKENRTPKKTPSKKKVNDENELSDSMDSHDVTMRKSTILYDQNADVAGQNLFSFRTPKKRDGMAQLAALAPKTPQTPKTPKHVQRRMEAQVGTPKTPKNSISSLPSKTPCRLRSILKKELSKFAKVETSGSDFSADESDDYKPGEKSEDSDEDSEDSDSDSSVEAKEEPKKRYCPPPSKTPVSGRPTRNSSRRQHDFVPESEDYFNHHTNKKSITSDRTLDRMKTPRLPHDHLFRLLANTTLSTAHERAITEMHEDYRQNFAKWLFILDEGYNIIVHGLGSKGNLLQQFHQDVLSDRSVIVVNGFFPSLTIKDVLDSISVDLLELSVTSRNHHEIVDAIADELADNPTTHVFLIVHNIDGAMLRNDNAQLVLSRLAKIKQIHMIASVDHINAPLLWDHIKLSNFNFSWWDVTTLLPYTEETAFENSMLVNQSGGLALSSMKNVFLSLTNNSRGIFLVIVRNQLTHKGNATFQGMPFKELYSRCRENFLVSSDVALRSQLTEFIDHNLVKMKRTSDGIEHLLIPLDASLLEQFLELQESIA